MNAYTNQARTELHEWQRQMQQPPGLFNRISKNIQVRVNKVIPEKIHSVLTQAIKQMVRAVVFGVGYTTPQPRTFATLEEMETFVRRRIEFYRTTAAAEGAVTGAGGILLGFADFPLWLTVKMKLLYEIAAAYGYDVKDYKERVYILHIFQLTFSSQKHRNAVYKTIADWERVRETLPEDIDQFDWRSFQQEYRDYIDLAKLLQLIPGVGAAVGAYVNHRLTSKLGHFAMQAYRMRGMPKYLIGRRLP